MTDWLQLARLVMLALLTTAGLAVPAAAQTEPARSFADLPATLKVGDRISVKDDNGKRVKGELGQWSPESLVVYTKGVLPAQHKFDRHQVAEIVAVDSTRDGFWIGFATGAVPGILLAAGVNSYCYNESPNHCPGAFPLLGGLFGLAGGLIGQAVDGAVNRGPVLYAPAPRSGRRASVQPFATAGARGGGVMVSVGF
jgi:hypothetical protein